jgi:hypothetical protein
LEGTKEGLIVLKINFDGFFFSQEERKGERVFITRVHDRLAMLAATERLA